MSVSQKEIYVYDDFSFQEPAILGILYINTEKGGQT